MSDSVVDKNGKEIIHCGDCDFCSVDNLCHNTDISDGKIAYPYPVNGNLIPPPNCPYRASKEVPIGIIPREIYFERRYCDVINACMRYARANVEIPKKWLEEYRDLKESGWISGSQLQYIDLSNLIGE